MHVGHDVTCLYSNFGGGLSTEQKRQEDRNEQAINVHIVLRASAAVPPGLVRLIT